VLLLALGPAVCAAVLRQLPEDDVEAITARMARIESVAPSVVEEVLKDYERALATHDIQIAGSIHNVREALTEAFGRDQAVRLLDRLTKTLSEEESHFDNLRKVEPEQLAKFVQDEHPQTIAFILAHLDPSQAAGVLSALPAELRHGVVRRVSALDRISPDSVRAVAAVVHQKLRNLGELSRGVSGGIRAVADVFNRLDATTCSELLDALEREDPELFDNVRRYMFVFEDLLSVGEAAMKELLQKVDRPVLAKALKGASEELRNLAMSCMSKRAAEILKDDIVNSGPVKLKEVEAAQQAVIAVARELERSGVISLKSSSAEQYVQ
jgi:flagellar motor switch protein FliG